MKKQIAWVLAVLVLLIVSLPVSAEQGEASRLKLAAPFVDGVVLQRGMSVPVWGWGDPGAGIVVEFAGQQKATKVGKDGKWRVELDPLRANADPRTIKVAFNIAGVLESKLVKDVLVGEVWVASGQSNMQWPASKCDVGRVLQKGIKERVDAGDENPPIIREAKVTDVFSALHPIEHASVEWIDDGANMSAIAYAFAYELWKELGVPIGILNCSFSSTSIEAWTPREGFEAQAKNTYWLNHPRNRALIRRLRETDPSSPEYKAAWSGFYKAIEDAIQANERRLAAGEEPEPISIQPPGNFRGNRDATWLYNARMHPVVPYAIRGAIWNQGYASMNDGGHYYGSLHSLVAGWRAVWGRPDLPVYFHQFYSNSVAEGNRPQVGGAADMRFATATARDIPGTGMASQIDIEGSIHYDRKALPGQRLALHALKHPYGKDIVADGPIFNGTSYTDGKVTLYFQNANGGLVVGEIQGDNKGPIKPVVIPNGEDQVTLFYLADENKVWHRAACKIVGNKIELTAPGIGKPKGVSYGSGGIGFQPNIYNKAMLPLSPFTWYDSQPVMQLNGWEPPLKVADYQPDPSAGGLQYEFRKMPLLSTQFRDNAVLQHGQPVKVWGSAIHDWGPEHHAKLVGDREAVIQFSFGEVKKTIPVKPGMEQWSVTLDPMVPTDKPRTLRAAFYVGGELVHERVAENVVVGDVWFVAAPDVKLDLPATEPAGGVVRVMQREAKRDRFARPSRYSVCVSTTPKNRFASFWADTDTRGLAGQIAHRIAARVEHPVGVIFMQSNGGKNADNPPLKSWIPFHALADAPSLAEDYEKLGAMYPGSPSYNANLRRYVDDWKTYWDAYVPEMIAEKRVPDGSPWGVYPTLASRENKSEATQSYNVMVHSFTPAALKGVVFITAGPSAFHGIDPVDAAAQMGVLRQSWAKRFGGSPTFSTIVLGNAGADLKHLGWASTTYLSEFETDERSGVPAVGGALLDAVDRAVAPAYGGVKAE